MPETTSHPRFRESSYSGSITQNCVEVANLPSGAAISDSQHPQGGHIAFPARETTAFLNAMRRGEL
ncbi:DUF397 domain-containing protein [Nocardiopsis ansamitocini]|uniref:DUF397 domain-containing protein n=1 Tax=Nocardiopsis ansamitocini TaxID=1670832 RepID=A0A9W6UKH0_9ACTN|nr:DUF397 domain-containing protein [Nocardiopsis ansamitocini]GLU49954.1 hypothetical protein Nans01_43050 [Nocardiopsis ansamitocini]